MKRHHVLLASIVFGLTQFGAGVAAHESEDRHFDQGAALQVPRIDAVFLLDTTGSMTELIQGAKVKIWSIATKMMSARIKPEIRMALIGYRDRQDIYVTRSFNFTGDIDAIYGELLKFRAEGGGDRPESVNQALDEAVNDLSWDWSPQVYRVAFLVGDSPPKMNYLDDVKYDVTAHRAHQRDIIVNTLLAGGAQDTGAIWREIARLTHGSYSEIPLSGGVQIIETPYDQDIQQLSGRLNATALPYGSSKQQDDIRAKLDRSSSAPSSVAADKMEFLKEKGVESELVTGTGELVNDIATGKVHLEELEEDALPPELQGLDARAREEAIARRRDERADLKNKIDTLLEQRAGYLAEEEAKRVAEGTSDSFDREVLEAIHKQGRAKGLLYE